MRDVHIQSKREIQSIILSGVQAEINICLGWDTRFRRAAKTGFPHSLRFTFVKCLCKVFSAAIEMEIKSNKRKTQDSLCLNFTPEWAGINFPTRTLEFELSWVQGQLKLGAESNAYLILSLLSSCFVF